MTVREEDARTAHLARTLWQEDGSALPVDIGRIAQRFAFSFEYRRAPRGFRGALFAAQHLIVINAGLPTCQQRYVIAHELGHWLVGTRRLRIRQARVERVCQLFAAHLLLPPDRVAASARAAYGRADLLDQLAADYLVTPSAMCIHLQQLGLLPGGATHTLEREIADAAWCDPQLTADLTPREDLRVPLWEVDIDAAYPSGVLNSEF